MSWMQRMKAAAEKAKKAADGFGEMEFMSDEEAFGDKPTAPTAANKEAKLAEMDLIRKMMPPEMVKAMPWLIDKEFYGTLTDPLGANLKEMARQNQTTPQAITEKVYGMWKALHEAPPGPNRAAAIHDATDISIAEFKATNPTAKHIACKAGCSGCCHVTVNIISDEAELLALVIAAGEVEVDFAKLHRQAQIPEDAWAWAKTSYDERGCVFLQKDGKCGVYKYRPFVCRKWFVPKMKGVPEHCGNLNAKGPIIVDINAELVGSAAYNLDFNSKRLATYVLEKLVEMNFVDAKTGQPTDLALEHMAAVKKRKESNGRDAVTVSGEGNSRSQDGAQSPDGNL